MVKLLSQIRAKAHMVKAAAVIQVQNGIGALQIFSCKGSSKADFFLNEKLLIETIIGCPTCAASLARGYGINNINAKEITDIRDAINEPFVNIETSIANISPLLNMFQDGYYLVTDNFAYPTCGKPSKSHYFWNLNDYGNGILHNLYGRWAETHHFPSYLAASEYPASFNKDRLFYYAERLIENEKLFPRAVVLYLNGGVGLVLDGHHKVAATAYCGVLAKCLSVFPIYPIDKTFHEKITSSARYNLQEWTNDLVYNQAGDIVGTKPSARNQLLICDLNGDSIANVVSFRSTAKGISIDKFYKLEGYKKIEKSDDNGEYYEDYWESSKEYKNHKKGAKGNNVPEQYFTDLTYIPNSSDYSLATEIPLDRIKLALRDFYKFDKDINKYYLAIRLKIYYEIFKEQKWLTDNDYKNICIFLKSGQINTS